MSKNKWLGRTLITLLIIVVLVAGGYAIYRYGYTRGFIAANQGEMPNAFMGMPGGMPHDFGRMQGFFNQDGKDLPRGGFGRAGVGPGGAGNYQFDRPYMQYSMHTGFPAQGYLFSPFSLLFRILFWGIILWLVYKVIMLLLGGQGWKLSFKRYEDQLEEEVQPEKRSRKKS